MARFLLLALSLTASSAAIVEDSDWKMGPPHGSNTSALCPVNGVEINITAKTPFVLFTKGQKLYFSSDDAAAAYKAKPRDYWLGPYDTPLPGMDGMRGKPDVRGQILHCPRSGEALNVSMQTPRVLHKHGQAVYFCCFGCVTTFWRDPTPFIV